MSEFNWLPNSVLKQVPYLPELAFINDPTIAGQYWHPHENNPRGLIEISYNTTKDLKGYASTLAHEFRHHWQWFNFMPLKNYLEWHKIIKKHNSDDALRIYFNKNETEKDAILFEYKLVKDEYINYWIKHILGWKI